MRRILITLLALGLAGPISASAQQLVQLAGKGSTSAGTISANGGSITISTAGMATLRLQTLDTYSGTWEVQCSVDGGTTYDTDDEVNLSLEGSTSAPAQSVTDTVGIWIANVAGCSTVKVIATAGFAASDTTFAYQAIQTGGGASSGSSGGGGEVTNAGTFAVQESGTLLTEVQSLTHAEDSAHSSTNVGVMPLAVRQDSQSDLAADGDYIPMTVDADGGLRVSIVSGAGSGGTALADDADFADGTTSGTPIGGVAESAAPTTVTEGDFGWAAITLNRALKVALFDTSGNALTPSADMTIGSAYGSTAPGSVGSYKDFDGAALPTTANVNTEEEANPFAVTLQGVQFGFLTNEDGSKQLGKLEDDAHASADYGVPIFGRRIDTLAPSSGTSGDYETINVSAEGAVYTAPTATTNGGCTPGSILSANTVNETAVKASAGQLYFLNVTNIGANEVFFKLYNDTTANIDETDTPIQRYVIPGNAAGAGNTFSIAVGMTFSTAITFRITGAAADNDTTAIAANEVLVSYCYK